MELRQLFQAVLWKWIKQGERSSRMRKRPIDILTPRENRLIALLAGGLSNRQIGEKTRATECAVKNQMHGIFLKTGRENRVQVAIDWMTGRIPRTV